MDKREKQERWDLMKQRNWTYKTYKCAWCKGPFVERPSLYRYRKRKSKAKKVFCKPKCFYEWVQFK